MTHDDHALARDLATEAGALLLRLRADRGFGDLKALRDAGDRESHVYLTEALARQRPGDSVLSEEGKDELSRLDAERVWIVDPLDGTREYAEEGRGDWAVHVALWQRDEGAAERARGGRGRTSLTGPYALDRRALRASERRHRAHPGRGEPQLLPPEFTTRLAEHLDAEVELVPLGSAGAKVAAVLLGDVDAYVHAAWTVRMGLRRPGRRRPRGRRPRLADRRVAADLQPRGHQPARYSGLPPGTGANAAHAASGRSCNEPTREC